MTTMSQLRKAARALPETEEDTHAGMVVFSVCGTGFASVTEDGRVLLPLPQAEIEAAELAYPTGERIVQQDTPISFGVPLADINGKDLNALVRGAWYFRAPKRVTETLAAADAGSKPAGCDLPDAIGKPATRALLGAGITTLTHVATCTEGELLALHGIGPKAVRILSEKLATKGMSLR